MKFLVSRIYTARKQKGISELSLNQDLSRAGNHQNSIYSIMKRKKNQDQKFKDLYYVGGTVHPGGGMPLALRSGVNTANKIINEIR